MNKVFKNCALNVFIALAFFISNIVNVHANQSHENLQKEEISISKTELEDRKEASIITTPYTLSLNSRGENKDTFKGKIEKVVEPVTIGVFGLGIAIGYAISAVSIFLGWTISAIKSRM